MLRGRAMLLVVLASCLIGRRGVAATMVFFDRASFLAELSTSTTYTFQSSDGFPVAPSEISSFGDGAVMSTSVDGPASIGVYSAPGWSQVLTGRAALSAGVPQVDFLVPVTLNFAQPVNGVGFDALATATEGAAVPVLRVIYAGDQQESEIVGPPGNADPLSFLGVISTDPIIGIQFYAAPADHPDVTGVCGGAMENLTLGTAIPEPATLGIVAGLVLPFHRPSRRAIMRHATDRS